MLTKRPERLVQLADSLRWSPNVWMGVSIENRRFVHRADSLREVPASVRFVSAEPLLGPLDDLDLTDIDWLIAGGESSYRHRPIRPEWGALFVIVARTMASPSSSSNGAVAVRRRVGASWTAGLGTRCRRPHVWPSHRR